MFLLQFESLSSHYNWKRRLEAVLKHSRSACSLPNLANRPRAQFLSANEAQHGIGGTGSDDQRHADAHVEDLVKFVFRHAAFFGEDLENGEHLPRTFADNYVAVLRQHAGNIIDEAAAGNVSDAFNDAPL